MGDYFDCLHFTYKGQEFEVRVTNDSYDIPDGKLRLEVWTCSDEDGLIGCVEEKILEEIA